MILSYHENRVKTCFLTFQIEMSQKVCCHQTVYDFLKLKLDYLSISWVTMKFKMDTPKDGVAAFTSLMEAHLSYFTTNVNISSQSVLKNSERKTFSDCQTGQVRVFLNVVHKFEWIQLKINLGRLIL